MKKLNLLSRAEMKNVMGGRAASNSGGNCGTSDCKTDADCTTPNPKCHYTTCESDATKLNFCGV